MVFSPTYLLFMFTLMLSILLSISSSSWFSAWIGLELNMMSFIPLITMKPSSSLSESALKYFLIQALGSTLFIMSSSLYISMSPLASPLILTALLLKLASSPFHFWFPQVMQGLLWPQAIILMTIQKLAPLILISYLSFSYIMIQIIILSSMLSAMMGSIGGLNSMHLRKVMAFSSINHMSWMLIAILISEMLLIMYFTLYSLITTSVIVLLYMFNTYNFHDLLKSNFNNMMYLFVLPLSLMSLGGLPPFTGFIPKWMMIQAMLQNNMIFPLMILLASALITLYFYMRILIPFIIMNNPSMSFNMMHLWSSSFMYPMSLISFFNLSGLLIPMMFIIL
uniref:NADH dehydrogenase subunit 2 n=1 Tax=Tzotzilthelphusa villarosalensis TaxID=2761036 RepID=UPI002869F6C4|nr:NADH dehydrogenase subunit 2 [Tzotzilthelphusa villarosalensis]WKW91700.1 NADH dehydrogenase subunit 2 [Tzotzilthelphusa villarosalensis]